MMPLRAVYVCVCVCMCLNLSSSLCRVAHAKHSRDKTHPKNCQIENNHTILPNLCNPM